LYEYWQLKPILAPPSSMATDGMAVPV